MIPNFSTLRQFFVYFWIWEFVVRPMVRTVKLREFKTGDELALFEVFYTAIHQVCSKDYTQEQIEAWAPKSLNRDVWSEKIRQIQPFVAQFGTKIVGYSDLQENGLIDHFFVHGDYQGMGVGHALMTEIIVRGSAMPLLKSEVSHTASEFYEKHGFKIVGEQKIEIRGVELSNNLMERWMR